MTLGLALSILQSGKQVNGRMNMINYIKCDAVKLSRGFVPSLSLRDSHGNQVDFKFLNHLLKKTKRGGIGAAKKVAAANYPLAVIIQ